MKRIIFFLIFIFFSQIYYVQSPIPSWELSSQSIELFSSKNPEIFLRYKAEYDGITPILNKEITKSENGITIKNNYTLYLITP